MAETQTESDGPVSDADMPSLTHVASDPAFPADDLHPGLAKEQPSAAHQDKLSKLNGKKAS